MHVISKELFYERISDMDKCGALHYWEKNCLKACISPYWILNAAKGSAKFFVPIYLLKLLINYKRYNDVDFLKELLLSELTSTLYGVVMAFFIFSSICSLRKIFGRLHYYGILFIPGFVSGLSVLVETQENQNMDTLIFFNSFVEAILNNLDYFDIFKITKTRETLMFMTVSATLMYLLENRKKKINYTHFWFYTPPRKNVDSNDQNLCSHPNNCYIFLFKGFIKYFSLGYMVNIIRKLLPKIGILSKKPLEIIRILFNEANVKFGLFIGSYVALYRILTCYFNRTDMIGKRFHGLIAGFFSGMTYLISPNIQVLVVGISTLMQLMYENISSRLNITNHSVPRQLLYMFCHGALLHNKFMNPNTCPAYYRNMIDFCTNNTTAEIYKKLIAEYFL